MIQPLIRPWQPDDTEALRGMIWDCLTDTFNQGADMVPDNHNTDLLLVIGMKWAFSGDPALVAIIDDTIIGYVMWGDPESRFSLRERIAVGFGTYVEPAYRRCHIASALRLEAQRIAKERGYTRVQGVAYDSTAVRSCLALGWRVTAKQVEVRL